MNGIVFSRPELENSQKNRKKISKKLKNIILASLPYETGRDRPKKREKIFLVQNCFYLTWAIEFRKKFKKIKNIILDSFRVETGHDMLKKSEIFFLVWNRFSPTRALEILEK